MNFRLEEKLKRRKIIGIILIAVTIIFVLLCVFFLTQKQKFEIEKGVAEALKAYSASMEGTDVKVLNREINNAVEERLKELNSQELSEEEIQLLVQEVTNELRYKFQHISEEEKTIIESNIQQLEQLIEEINKGIEVIRLEMGDTTGKLEVSIEELENQLTLIQQELNQMKEQAQTMEKNVLYYQYDEATQTLKMYGK